MMTMTPESFGQRFPSLRLDPAEIGLLLGMLQPRELADGERLIAYGQHADTLYLVWSGTLVLTLEHGGARLRLGTIKAGSWVGDFGFIDPGKAAADVSAEGPVTVLAMSQGDRGKLYQRAPEAASALLRALSVELARRLRATNRQVLEKEGENAYDLREVVPANREGVGTQARWLDRVRKLLGLNGER